MRNTEIFLFCLVCSMLVISAITNVATIGRNNELNREIDELIDDVDDLRESRDKWKERFNTYECPECESETTTEYINTTEIVYETIWNNNTIYVDNAIFDVNRDRVVDYKDACEVLYYLKHGISMREEWTFNKYGNPYEKLYDVNRDGRVNVTDVDDIWKNSDIVW